MESNINNLRKVSRSENFRSLRNRFFRVDSVPIPYLNSIESIPSLKFSLVQDLEDTLYPHQINKITIGNEIYFFKQELNADVSFKEGLFYIVYPDLKIVVWGNTREDAEEAFDFMVRCLIVNIYLSDQLSMNLSSLKLKSLLHDLIESK